MKTDRHHLFGLVLISIIVFVNFTAIGQYREITGKTYAERSPVLFDFYVNGLRPVILDSATACRKIEAIEKAAHSAGDEELLLETALMRIHFMYYRSHYSRENILQSLDSLCKVARQKKKTWLEARVESLTALTCFKDGYNYELGFIHFQKVNELVKDLPIAIFPDKQHCYYQMGYASFEFSEWKNAIQYLAEGLKETPEFPPLKANIQINNTLGICYQKLNKPDSSDYYFRQILAILPRDKHDSMVWSGIAMGNLGYNQFLRGNYDKAIPLLENDVAIAEQNNDWGLAVGSLVPLAEIALKKGNLQLFKDLTIKAKDYSVRSGQYKRWEKVYPLLAKLSAMDGNAVQSAIYLDSAIIVKDSLARKFNAMQMARAIQRVELEKYATELNLVETEKKLKIWERNILVVVLISLIFLSGYLYRKQRNNVQRKQAELLRTESELREASAQLDLFTRNISEKNLMIEEILRQNQGIQSEAIDQLKQKTILTEEDWQNFQGLFEKVHGGYLNRLKEKLPGLSPAETRFMALSKLGLKNKEMAATLGVGSDAVRQYRSRLRKKLHLPEDGSIEELVNSI